MTAPAISLQLYTVNDALTADLDGTLARLAEIGFTTVEAFDFVHRAPELKAAFDRHGITAATGHGFLVNETIALPDGGSMQVPSRTETLAAAKELGMEVVIDPFSGGDHWRTREGVEYVAQRLSEAADEAEELGLSVGYHNHDFEVRPQIDGKPALQVLAEIVDPRVLFEVDLYWATASEVDVPALLTAIGDRIVALHVKDGPMAGGRSTNPVPTDQTPAGQGDVDLEADFAAAPSARFHVIEFDHFEGDILDGVAQSYAWLAARGDGAAA
jgi:sugar phosphate isomerase/epimerase